MNVSRSLPPTTDSPDAPAPTRPMQGTCAHTSGRRGNRPAFPASERREHRTRELLTEARSEGLSRAEAEALRHEAVEVNRVLALAIARRYHRKGVEDEDIDQVAMVGLCLAVDRWDPSSVTPFAAFAAPTISGEIKRHFRDRAWLVRPPRSLQNRYAEMRAAMGDLQAELGREPSTAEIAGRLNVSVRDVLQARRAGDAFRGSPLDQPDGTGYSLSDRLGDDQQSLEQIAERLDLRRALARLSPRDRRLVQLRFVEELTQQQVGRILGISQMQVSRLLVRLLLTLRQSLEPATSGTPPQAA